MKGYLVGLIGMWILTDGLISIRLYLPTEQTWLKDHSIRLLRCAAGVALMILGALYA
jgi:hypothetical protein